MRPSLRAGIAALTLGLVAAGTFAPSPAVADGGAYRGGGARVVADEFQGPLGLGPARRGFVVGDSAAGQVVHVRASTGRKRVLVNGADGVAGVTSRGKWVYSVTGEAEGPGGRFGGSRVLRTNLETGRTTVLANLLRYERRNNPDGQDQSVDALSNPYGLTMTSRGLLVADGGANDVLLVNPRSGRVSTFFVPPVVTTGGCAGLPNNPGTVGCDPVPTGVVQRGNDVYVSTLGAEVPGAGRIYRLGLRSQRVERVWRGLDAPTGLAVSARRDLFYSQVLEGFPQGPPPPGFDPSTVGSIVKIARNGRTSTAQVTMPTGLLFRGGRLFAVTWSLAPFLQIPDAGELRRVGAGQFR
jgi:hypothetical protein